MRIDKYEPLKRVVMIISLIRTILMSLVLFQISCDEDEDKKAKVGAKMRSTGFSLSLVGGSVIGLRRHDSRSPIRLNESLIANSSFNLESYKVPISRINLGVDSGSGVESLSPDIYSCPGTTDDECLVDLSQGINIDDLLQNNSSAEFKLDEEISYDSVLVEYCHEGSGFSVLVKGTVTLGSTTYYTNAVSGLSTSSPSEEVAIPITSTGCGSTTRLVNPLTVTPEEGDDATQVNIVLYADPTGAIYGTDSQTLVNSNCIGEETLAICSDAVSIFGAISDETPTIERYQLVTSGDYANLMLTLIFDENDEPFGSSLLSLFTNTSQARSLHSGITAATPVKNADGTISISYSNSDLISNFIRGTHDNTVDQVTVVSPLEFSAVPL